VARARNLSSWIALAAGLVAPVHFLDAQTPGTLAGIVRDSMGRPLREAVVVLDPNDDIRATRTDLEGRFRFERLRAKRYHMRTTWIGYQPDERTIDVPAGGLEVAITLTRLPFRLDTMTVVARRTGIFGTAVDKKDFHALGGVEVSILGTRHRIRTSSDGTFSFGDVRPGGWVVKGKRDGFETTMFSVIVSDTAAVELAMAMDTIVTKSQALAEARLFEMQMRVNRRDANSSAIVVGQEFAAHRGQSLDVALRYSPTFLTKGLMFRNVECIFINGIPRPTLLAKDIAADDVAMVEVYNYRGGATYTDQQLFRNNGNACGSGPVQEVFGPRGSQLRAVRPPNQTVVAYIHIWLK
jgi:hypothetical protein